ncbi:class III lanthionine synthetase LanKC N-terminal domain-containing protein, partial [Bifidobacterium longum]|nr:lanthionine synthetase [Bifidobacterium longum]
MIGEEDYLESITKQSPFFVDHASMLPSMKRDHWIAESLIPDTWYVTRREPWTYVSSPNGKMRVNGWKIHLSATKENAEKILAEVIQICCKYNTTFKFQSSHRDFLNCNGKAANRSG